VRFTALTQWCEYEVENENAVERVKIEAEALLFNPGCGFGGGVFCLRFSVPGNMPKCEGGGVVELPLLGRCYTRLEYREKPAALEETDYRVETKSNPGNIVARTEVHQRVK